MTRSILALSDGSRVHSVDGVAVVGSYQTTPATTTPYKVRGLHITPKTERVVEIALTKEEAQKLVRDWISFGLFGRHGRIATRPNGGAK